MFLSISTTHQPATDIGHLLRKHPDNVHRAELSFGRSLFFYPQADAERCEGVLMLDVDPLQLVRGREGDAGPGLLDHYVNDRPYAASSFLSVAINRVLRDAMAGRAPDREELADTAIPLEFVVTPLPCRGGDETVRRLFEPLGYQVETRSAPLNERWPDWGESPYLTLRLAAEARLADALTHLYVLVPVLDGRKHYWVGEDEVTKLVERGGAWLQAHPERDLIAHRYLRRRRLARDALAVLDERFGLTDDEGETEDERADAAEERLEQPLGLNAQRYEAVAATLRELGARRVCDLGCGDGKLIRRLLQEPTLQRVVGFDVSTVALETATRRLGLDRMSPTQRSRVDVFRGSLVYEDERFADYDAITLVEVVEHVDAERLDALERVVFGVAAPPAVIVSTPNVEYNACFDGMEAGRLRHDDHRFEWTRAEFAAWAEGVCARRGYTVRLDGVGEVHEQFGQPTQLAVFERSPAP